MTQHGGPRVNNVEEGEAGDLVVNVDEVQTSLLVVKERLLKGGVFSGCDEGCSDCEDSENGCEKGPGRAPRTASTPITTSTLVTISAPVTVGTPTTIVASNRRPVESSRAVPWKYDNAFRNNRRSGSQIRPVNQAPITIGVPVRAPVTVGPAVDNVGGPGGFTRSGRLFAPQTLRDRNAEALAKAKGKQVVVEEGPVQKENNNNNNNKNYNKNNKEKNNNNNNKNNNKSNNKNNNKNKNNKTNNNKKNKKNNN
ncbi:uncharacterized protein LOC127094174 [Lathyrus oleraceus]|uniref:uncharacterized protein LOC127094174 n=1 Tax=Pisum sativum TaxID=3888 RepID=UPI0021D16BA7|nr:uncharacterized protein LOC127094174 [Pisum sativum]